MVVSSTRPDTEAGLDCFLPGVGDTGEDALFLERDIQDSHWLSSYITVLVLLRQLSYAIKNQLVASKAPY